MQVLRSHLSSGRVIILALAVAGMAIGGVSGQSPLALGDDDFAEVGLPFAFPFCSDEYNSVFVGSNGFVTFGVGDTQFDESVAGLLDQPPRIAPLWVDLSPNIGGVVTTEVAAGNFVVTWAGVPEFGTGNSNTFALTLRPDGTFSFDYVALDATSGLAGVSPGLGALTVDPGEIDLSVAAQPISGVAGEAVYELFAGDNDLSGQSLEWDDCPVVEFPRLALPGVCYGSTGGGGGTKGSLLTIDTGTGAATVLGSTGLDGVPGLAINSSGQIFGTDRTDGNLYRIDALLGVPVLFAVTELDFLDAIAFDENDLLYGVYFDPADGSTLVTIDLSTGFIATIGTVNDAIVGLAFDPDPTDGQLYGSVGGFGAVESGGIYRIDTTTAALTALSGPFLGGATPDLLFNASGNLFGTKGGGGGTSGGGGGGAPSDLIAINKATGAAQVVGSTGVPSVSGLSCAAPAGDQDEDGVSDSEDLCPDTAIPEFVPTQELKANRWALLNGDTEFDTGVAKGKSEKPPRSFTIEDTKGCSCDQIIGVLGLGGGHEKFGCNTDAMDTFIDLVNP